VVASVISVDRLRKTYGTFVAVEDVSFEVEEGEIFGLLGPNGAGKTTSVECAQGLRVPDAGDISVLGLDPRTEGSQLRQLVGSQLQESALPGRLKVWEALDLFASLVPGGPDWRQVMERWDLTGKASASFSSLSGGQRQRLLVALAVVNEPRVVFLDEMTTGLDPAARRATWQLIEAIRDGGATLVLVTHFMDEAEQLCDRLTIVDEGRVVATGSPQSLIAEHGGDLLIHFSTDRPDVSFLDAIESVHTVSRHGPHVTVAGHGPVLALVGAELVRNGIVPTDLRVQQSTLEDVFLRLTGHGLAE
jgi:ABC-2 type transport system ATP-binding protein